jgi:Polyketide cyclase / dehydrase and lipid transport
MWTTEHSIETTVSPEAIWRVWADVARWGEWNGDDAHIELSGPFAAGSTITMTTGSGDRTRLKIVEAVEPELFVDQLRFWFLLQRTIHRVERIDTERVRVVYRMEIRGPLSGKFGREMGPRIDADLAKVLAALVERAQR